MFFRAIIGIFKNIYFEEYMGGAASENRIDTSDMNMLSERAVPLVTC